MKFLTFGERDTALYLLLIPLLFGVAAVDKGSTKSGDDAPFPRQHDKTREKKSVRGKRRKRRRPRPRADRGLPSDKTLAEMAWKYLSIQHQLWPELAKQGLLPALNDATSVRLAADFKKRFRDGVNVEPALLPVSNAWKSIAGAYVRFSCDKSNSRSLVQQLRLILERAHTNGHFVPWAYVFADAALSATNADRPSYKLAKATVDQVDSLLDVLYLDEIGRASRDAVEALKLGKLIERRSKRLIGVSDAFDSDSQMSKMTLSIFAMVQEWFVDQLRLKVDRGMHDAFYQGTNLRPPPFGYTLVPAIDEQGKAILGKNSEQCNMLEIDDGEMKSVVLAFRLYGERNKSLSAIGRLFNRHRIGNQSWDASRLKQFFKRYKYVGINVENMTHRETNYDDKGNKVSVTKTRPRNEWRVRRVPHLRIVSWKLWKKVQQRLANSAKAYSKNGDRSLNRSDVNPTTLVRPLCGCCKKPMSLGKSGKYASFTCINGRDGKHACKYRGYKSVKVVENAILGHVLDGVLSEDRFATLVTAANEYLRTEAAKPTVDSSDWKSEIKSITAKRNRLAAILEHEGNHGLGVVVKKIRRYEKLLRSLRRKIQEAEVAKSVPAAITEAQSLELLENIRDVLRQDVAMAAPLLKAITGPVVVRIEKEPGRKRSVWYAEFSVNLVPVCAKLATADRLPTARTWEYLCTRSWKLPTEVSIRLEKSADYEETSPKMRKMHEAGASIQTIASAFSLSWSYARDILHFAYTGERPTWGKSFMKKVGGKPEVYRKIAKDVTYMRDELKMSWPKIGEALAKKGIKASEGTVRRAWDHAHPEIVQEAANRGEIPNRGCYSHIDVDVKERIRALLRASDMSLTQIAERTGVSPQTVSRERDNLDRSDSDDRKID